MPADFLAIVGELFLLVFVSILVVLGSSLGAILESLGVILVTLAPFGSSGGVPGPPWPGLGPQVEKSSNFCVNSPSLLDAFGTTFWYFFVFGDVFP